jgi:hypothetical protein
MPNTGIEPVTFTLRMCCSTVELVGLKLAQDRTRTYDLEFTKLLLYHLSYLGDLSNAINIIVKYTDNDFRILLNSLA